MASLRAPCQTPRDSATLKDGPSAVGTHGARSDAIHLRHSPFRLTKRQWAVGPPARPRFQSHPRQCDTAFGKGCGRAGAFPMRRARVAGGGGVALSLPAARSKIGGSAASLCLQGLPRGRDPRLRCRRGARGDVCVQPARARRLPQPSDDPDRRQRRVRHGGRHVHHRPLRQSRPRAVVAGPDRPRRAGAAASAAVGVNEHPAGLFRPGDQPREIASLSVERRLHLHRGHRWHGAAHFCRDERRAAAGPHALPHSKALRALHSGNSLQSSSDFRITQKAAPVSRAAFVILSE